MRDASLTFDPLDLIQRRPDAFAQSRRALGRLLLAQYAIDMLGVVVKRGQSRRMVLGDKSHDAAYSIPAARNGQARNVGQVAQEAD